MKKLKFIYFVLLSFGLIFLTYSAEVNALEGWTYYEPASYGPAINDFNADYWETDGPHGVEGHWNFDIQFELENNTSVERIYVVPDGWFTIDLFLQNQGGGGYQDWYSITVNNHYNEMEIECLMILYGEADEWTIDVSDEAYGLMDEGWVFEKADLPHPAEKQIYRIDFVFEVDFHIDLSGLYFEEISNAAPQYVLELYYNPNVIYQAGYDDGYQDGYDDGILETDAYDDGYQEGFREGFWAGFSEGLLESDIAEAYQQGFIDGEKSKLAENNAAFYSGIGKWLVPAVITVIVLGGIMSIVAIKRREQ